MGNIYEDEKYEWVRWDKKLELDISEIDEQHKRLVDICNRLHAGLVKCRTDRTTNWQEFYSMGLREMVNYTQSHFVVEEKMLQMTGYPDIETHKKRHAEFIGYAQNGLKSFNTATLQSAHDLSQFLREWIISHIACDDKLYVPTVKTFQEKQK